jgi:PAS domain S-box-containing protein
MSSTFGSVLKQSVISGAALGAALLAGFLLRPFLGREGPFLLCMLAVTATAYYAGFAAAVVATSLSAVVAGAILFRASIHPLLFDELVPPVVFCAIGVSASWFVEARRRAVQALEQTNRQLHDHLQIEHEARVTLDHLASQLRESEERYRVVAAITRDALWDWDVPADRTMWSDGMTRVFGYKPAEIGSESRWWQNRVHADDRDRVLEGLRQAMEGNAASWSDEFHVRRADGQYAAVISRASILRDGAGKPVRMIGSMLDMTDLKQAEKSLRDNQRFLLRLLKSVPSPVVLLDSKGKIVLFNRACEQISGYRRREVLGRTVPQALLAPDDIEHFERRMADPYAEQVCARHTSHWRTKSGELRAIEWSFTPVPAPDGGLRLPYLLGAGADVTDRSPSVAC